MMYITYIQNGVIRVYPHRVVLASVRSSRKDCELRSPAQSERRSEKTPLQNTKRYRTLTDDLVINYFM